MDCSDGQLGHQLFHANTEVSTTLVGGFNPSEKYEFVSWGLLFPICGKIKKMFQTSNQIWLGIS